MQNNHNFIKFQKLLYYIEIAQISSILTVKFILGRIFETKAQKQKDKWTGARQNQQNDMCAQRRLRSAWVSAQSDQSLRCALNG